MKYPGSLHCHTHFSNLRLRDSINRPESLISYAEELGHSVIAITEHEAVSGWVEIEELMPKHPNIKIIRGNEIYLCRDGLTKDNYKSGVDKYYHFILLAKDLIGARQIMELSTRAWLRSYEHNRQRRVPTYYKDLEEIIGANPGHVIASTACLGGLLATQILKYEDTQDKALRAHVVGWLRKMEAIFGTSNFYLEMQPSNDLDQYRVNSEIIKLSHELNIGTVITNDAHYMRKSDLKFEGIFLRAQDGEREVESFYESTYLMEDSEVRDRLKYIDESEIEKAYANINYIAAQCEDYTIKKPLKIPSLPWRTFREPTEAELQNYCELMPNLKNFIESSHQSDNMLVRAVIAGIEQHKDLQTKEAYDELDACLSDTWISSLANKAQWSAYFLNLQKIIDTCWDSGTIVGCGRGSGVGFLLLYCLDITQINPLREKTQTFRFRFLNPERVSVLN